MMNADKPDPADEPLAPALQRAVAALRPLPPSSPEAIARVVAAAQRGSMRERRPVTLQRAAWRVAGAFGAVAAGFALFVVLRHRPERAVAERVSGIARDARPAAMPRGSAPVIATRANASLATADAPQIVTFRLDRPRASAVAVVGDFNQWNARATPLARAGGGTWTAAIALTPGRHAYRFVVDDSLRVLDPAAPAEHDADLGVAHSVVVVGVP